MSGTKQHATLKSGLALIAAIAGLALLPGLSNAQPAPPPPSASALPSASAAPAAPSASASAPAAPPPTASAPPVAPPPAVKTVPGPPEPTPDQIAALAELQKEADAYEAAAKDYRAALTRIVKHHYEDRKRRVLSALDREIQIEKKGLLDAREEAIRRYEEFIAKYSGPNAHPENTPDAMFRLAALYEERARENETEVSEEELANRLKPAIALYKRIIVEFPKYRELAGVFYYLGHALNDSTRIEEAQQVWRSLVCHDRYAYPVEADPKDPDKDQVIPLVQDHDGAYWRDWERRHPEPLKKSGGGKTPKAAPRPAQPRKGGKPSPADELRDETEFITPYPTDCKMLAQKVRAGQDPRYVAEVWWLIGDYHFNEISEAGGPFNWNRAQAAYSNSLQYKKPPVYGVAMYKLAWTYFRQQRYKPSVLQFVELLRYADEQEKATGDPGTDFRGEAYTYIAGSLTYLDFEGPGAEEPFIPRNDVLDTEQDARKAEQKMRIAIDRVQDPALIPQDQKWTVEIYKAVAQEFKELNQYRNTIEISEIILKKWPGDCGAPVVQNQIAEIYDTMMRQSREGTAEFQEYSAKALEARTKLAQYVGADKPWVRGCINDPEAIQTAERLVRGGLRRAAADHTNAGRALAERALETGDKVEREPILESALKEYQLAAQGWEGYLQQDENSSDAYESRFWLADANHMVVVLTVALDRTPTQQQVEIAKRTAVAVRDSNEDNKYLQPSAFFVVDVAYQQLQDQYKRFKATNGVEGIEKLDGVKIENEGTKDAKVVKSPVPPAVLATIAAREEYAQRVPEASDVMVDFDGASVPQRRVYAFDAASYYFTYGQFDEAKKRFYPIYDAECGKTTLGYKAWDRLQSMANFENNVEESRKLATAAETRPCGITEEQKASESTFASTTRSRGFYIDAAKAYEEAEKLEKAGKKGPERDEAWRKAAALYKVALEKAPARNEAPEAAMLGANAYKQVGEYDQAIAMYQLFIKEYGSEEKLTALEKGDPKAEPPAKPDPAEYEKRKTALKDAYTELAKANVLFFTYRGAAEVYDTVSKNKRFPEDERRKAAKNAVDLYANLGEEQKMLDARQTLYGLNAPVSQKMEIDYLVAQADLKRWDETAPDEGANRSARMKATQSLEAYYQKNRNAREAARFNVQAAFNAAKMHRIGKDGKFKDWCSNTIKAFESYKSSAPTKDGRSEALGSLEADMAAECAYRAVDEDLKAKFDYETNHHRYTGTIDKVKLAFEKDLKEALDVWHPKLESVITTYASPKWSVAARARQGTLYDSVRTGLFNATPPAVKLYTDKEERLFKLAEESGRDDLAEQVDAIRQSRREQWRTAREQSLESADRPMIKFYTESVVWGRAYKVRAPSSDQALRRLAFFTDILGNAKMKDYSQGIVDPATKGAFTYVDNMFLRTRPGQTSELSPDGLPAPLPATP